MPKHRNGFRCSNLSRQASVICGAGVGDFQWITAQSRSQGLLKEKVGGEIKCARKM